MHLATVDRLKTNTIHVNSTLNSHFLWSQTVNTGVNIVVDSSCIRLELQQSIFTILVSAVCLHIIQAELRFLTRVCCISYSHKKQNDCIFWSKAANKSSG